MARPTLTSAQRTEQDRRHHRQLLEGMARCVSHNGYGATTIADVVREARVSKSTFYAHFADKEACYVALYSAAVDNVLDAMRAADAAAAADGLPWRAHLDAVNGAYLESLAAGGELTRSLLIEIQTAGSAALAMRRDVLDRYVVLMGDVASRLREGDARLRTLTPGLVLGAVGGINEIVMRAIETGPVTGVAGLAGVTGDLWAALLTAPAPALAP
ncbi:MAG: TetR/AcrR family transcriptional regulator [Conexibacter sp.]|nr:TetR/AcrR family transcriptional regulator [Conexibacter sp.]